MAKFVLNPDVKPHWAWRLVQAFAWVNMILSALIGLGLAGIGSYLLVSIIDNMETYTYIYGFILGQYAAIFTILILVCILVFDLALTMKRAVTQERFRKAVILLVINLGIWIGCGLMVKFEINPFTEVAKLVHAVVGPFFTEAVMQDFLQKLNQTAKAH